MSAVRIFDAGLQPERTLLAWRRTCLLLALGVAVAIRFGAIEDPQAAILLGLPAIALVVTSYALTSLRYRTVARALANDPRAAVAAGRAIAMVAVVAFSIGIVAVVFVIESSGVFR